jgi:predicted nuclease of predicted toxin-antitoxin system
MNYRKKLYIDARTKVSGKEAKIQKWDNPIDLDQWLQVRLDDLVANLPTPTSENFGNTDLTFDADRFHQADGNDWAISNDKTDFFGDLEFSLENSNKVLPVTLGNIGASDKLFLEGIGVDNSTTSYVGVSPSNDDNSYSFILSTIGDSPNNDGRYTYLFNDGNRSVLKSRVIAASSIVSDLTFTMEANSEEILFSGIGTNPTFRVSLPSINFNNLPSFADEAAAAALNAGDLYQTDGTGAAPLNVAGIIMVKQ